MKKLALVLAVAFFAVTAYAQEATKQEAPKKEETGSPSTENYPQWLIESLEAILKRMRDGE